MTVYNSINDIRSARCVVALGCFDGVHLGHARVIGKARETADALSLPLAVFTFKTPPKNYFLKGAVPMITDVSEKLSIFASLGVDICVCASPTEEIFSMSADDFIHDILIRRMGAVHAVCGFNYTFGKGGAGNTRLLAEIFGEKNVSIADAYVMNGVTVSSSQIRTAIESGDVVQARKLLGRPFSIFSRVVDGQHLARKLGFPTFNIIPPKGIVLPKRGVYLTSTFIEGMGDIYGITNIGVRPTVDTKIECAETHLFDFDGNLYGKTLTVKLLEFIREERRFESVEQMAEQIRTDIQRAKSLIEKT